MVLEGSSDERRLAEIRFGKNREELTDLNKYSAIWTDNADNQGKDLGYENNELKGAWTSIWCAMERLGRH